jgi:hypothetical protein
MMSSAGSPEIPFEAALGCVIRSSRAITGPLIVIAASDVYINCSRNLSIPLAGGVLIDQCSATV